MIDSHYGGRRKSSYSDANANCVEVAAATGRVASVRDTRQNGHGPMLKFPDVDLAFLYR